MKYITEFRDPELARRLFADIRGHAKADLAYRLMEFCGGHTHVIYRYGIHELLPKNVKLIHGPGCPVCVMPGNRIDEAINMTEQNKVILCTYGDLFRVPGTKDDSFYKAKARGGDIRMVYSTMDALQLAINNPTKEVVFFAIGFETTTPPTAVAILTAKERGTSNFSVFCNHVMTPPAINLILNAKDQKVEVDGFIGPAHVSSVIGLEPYEPFARDFHKPVVVTGFEPLDVLMGIRMLIEQINTGTSKVENQYTRVIRYSGNVKAREVINQVFQVAPSNDWRGLGTLPHSGLSIRDEYSFYDAEVRFNVTRVPFIEPKGCQCGAILQGRLAPTQCGFFGKKCTPDHPLGPCMVSSEGSCAAVYTYSRGPSTVKESRE